MRCIDKLGHKHSQHISHLQVKLTKKGLSKKGIKIGSDLPPRADDKKTGGH